VANITLSIEDALLQAARVRAVKEGTSVTRSAGARSNSMRDARMIASRVIASLPRGSMQIRVCRDVSLPDRPAKSCTTP